jgi:hypothetical protein
VALNTWHRKKPLSWIAEQGFQLKLVESFEFWGIGAAFSYPRKSTSFRPTSLLASGLHTKHSPLYVSTPIHVPFMRQRSLAGSLLSFASGNYSTLSAGTQCPK